MQLIATMAIAQNADDRALSVVNKTVDASLWWDSFTVLLNKLENVSLSSDLPPSLVNPNFSLVLRTTLCYDNVFAVN